MPDENGNAGTDNWRETLPDEIKDSPALKDIPDIPTLAKNHVDLQQHLGNSRRVPKPDEAEGDIDAYFDKILNQDEVTKGKIMKVPDLTQDEQAQSFYKQLGKPEKPEEYTLPEFAEDITVNENFIDVARKKAHQLNLTDAQFKNYVKDAVEESLASQSEMVNAHKADIDVLRELWGNAFDQNINEAVGFAKKTGAPEGMVEALESGGAESGLLKWLQGLARQTGSEISEVAGQEGGARVETPKELEDRRSALFRKMDELDKVGDYASKQQAKALYKEILEIGEKISPN